MYFKNWFQENFEYPYPSANWKRDLDDYGDKKRGNTFSPENSDENWKAAANEYAEELSLPKVIGRHEASGTNALIFPTENSKIVVRVSPDNFRNICERIIEREEFQSTGGVNVIIKQIRMEKLIFTWKERVILNWHDILLSKYKHERKIVDTLNLLKKLHIYSYKMDLNIEDMVDKLSEIPECVGISKAIKAGIPIEDVSEENIGLSMSGSKYSNQLQIIDC
jgi:hypothetical protein